MSDSITLSIISPNCHLPTQIVNCQSGWKAIDLKRHLNLVYPGNPQVEGQRLIFSGHLIEDDTILESLFNKNPISRTVHLVLDPSEAKKSSSLVHDFPSNELEKSNNDVDELKKEYLGYLREYYQTVSQSNIDGQVTWISEYSRYASQMQNNWGAAASPPQIRPQNDTPEAVVERNPNRGNILQRIGHFFGNRADMADENGVGVANAEDGREEGFDFVEFAHTLFRISLMVTICVMHSSWQRMLLVGFVAVFFYLHNEGRRNRRRVVPAQLPRMIPAPVQPQVIPILEQQGVADVPTDPIQSIDTQAQTQSSVITTDIGITSEGAPEETTSNAESSQPVNPPTNALRLIALTSLRFLYALVTSLVPELPVYLE